MEANKPSIQKERTQLTIILVAALGYFVDIYDLILFSIVRIPSLRTLGIAEDQLLGVGIKLLNLQMIGMLLGGILFGILGDKRGRVSVLFASILLYSLANIANAYVTSVEMYGWLRLLAGIGLAGELGLAITLVSESMPKEKRGYGTALVAGIGVCGGIAAMMVSTILTWQMAYLLGGVMGLLLLVLRMRMLDSHIYYLAQKIKIRKGDFLLLFSSKKRLLTYISCMFIGLPMWFVAGLLVTFAPEFGKSLGIVGSINTGIAVAACCLGLALGDISSGLISQYLESRKKVVKYFLLFLAGFIGIYLFIPSSNLTYFYMLYIFMGYAAGYWALFITMTSELFGTNLRATAATSIPNFSRGLVIPCTLAMSWLNSYFDIITSTFIIGTVCLGAAFLGLSQVHETFSKDLNYLDHQ